MYLEDHPDEAVYTPDKAIEVLRRKLDDLRVFRSACDFEPSAMVGIKQKAFQTYLMRLGEFLGWVTALHRCGLLSDIAYNQFSVEGRSTLVPTVTEVGG